MLCGVLKSLHFYVDHVLLEEGTDFQILGYLNKPVTLPSAARCNWVLKPLHDCGIGALLC